MKSYEWQRALLALAPEKEEAPVSQIVVGGMILQQHIDWKTSTKQFVGKTHLKNWLNKIGEPYGYSGATLYRYLLFLRDLDYFVISGNETGGMTLSLSLPREDWEVV